jgi:MFS family permease
MRIFTEQRWLALWAAMLGYMLDALDVLLYVFAVQTLREQFHWSASTAGLVSSATLITSAAGGILAGILADRFGRTRTLISARPAPPHRWVFCRCSPGAPLSGWDSAELGPPAPFSSPKAGRRNTAPKRLA